MIIKIGIRKFAAFTMLLIAYLIILMSVLITVVLTNPSNMQFDMQSFSSILIPLGTGLAAFSLMFFSANAAEHFADKEK